jgi:hypothetical protein
MAEKQNSIKASGFSSYLRDNWMLLYFLTAILLLVFGYGVAVGVYKWFPYKLIAEGVSAASDWTDNAEQYARIKPGKHLRPRHREGSGVSRHEPGRTDDGVTLLSGMWGEALGIRLVSMKGELLHEWTVSFNAIWPQAEHLSLQPHDWDTNIHGMWAQPNGDIIFNFEHAGLVSINACSEVNWKLPIGTHHVVHPAENGNIWVADGKLHTERDKRFPWLRAPFYEELMVELTPDGEIVNSISLLDIFYNSGYEALLVDPAEHKGLDNDGWRGTVITIREDITHLNDIEILRSEIAEAFPQFEAGDMMLSLRNLDLIIVVDGKTELIKWSMTGPWLFQHDPDFLPDGKIMLFDNRARQQGKIGTNGSRILTVDPVSRDLQVVYQGNDEDIFFSSQMGKQQLLENGNILIADPDGGRAFEVDSDGEIVWEYINHWSAEQVAVITQAMRLPQDYFSFSDAGCN